MTDKKSDMEKINSFSRRELKEDEVYTFNLTLCDNDIDRDFECFSPSALEELKTLFVGRTGIFDHSMKSADQKARIFDTYLEKSPTEKTQTGEALIRLKARAYMLKNEKNKALIEEIEGGIKKEVSVSCSMKSAVCSICGCDRKQSRCDHINGRKYGSKLCYTVLSSAEDAYEFSFVAVPAQRKAGVTKAYKPTEVTTLKDIIEKIHKNDGDIELTGVQVKQLSSYIDSLEEEAKLGEEYKKELCAEVTRLFAQRLPEVEKTLFSSVVSVMTVKELLGFKKGLESVAAVAEPQLSPAENGSKNDYSQFRI